MIGTWVKRFLSRLSPATTQTRHDDCWDVNLTPRGLDHRRLAKAFTDAYTGKALECYADRDIGLGTERHKTRPVMNHGIVGLLVFAFSEQQKKHIETALARANDDADSRCRLEIVQSHTYHDENPRFFHSTEMSIVDMS